MFPLPEAGSLPNSIQSPNLRAKERILHIHLATDTDPQEGLCRALQGIASAYTCLDQRTPQLQQRIMELAATFRPTLVFAQVHEPRVLLPATVRYLRRRLGIDVITWNGDIGGLSAPQHTEDWLYRLGKETTLALFADTYRPYLLRVRGVTSGFLAAGYDDGLFQPGPSSGTAYEAAFLGSNYAGTSLGSLADLRHEIVSALHRRYGARLGLFGGGWGELDSRIEPIHYSLSPAIYHVSGCAIDISAGATYGRCVSSRLFRALGCGVPVFAYRMEDAAGLGLSDGENCVLWSTLDELLTRIDATPPEQLAQIASKGLALAQQHHTWRHRMREMLWMLYRVRDDIPAPRTGFAQDREDEVVEALFAGRDPTTLRLLDLGANDGQQISNSRKLILSGWSGVLVEPSLTTFPHLLQRYGDVPRVVLVHAAIATGDRVRAWHERPEASGLSGTLFADMQNHPSRSPGTAWAPAKWMQFYMPILTPTELLSAFPGPYHFITIDTEGDSVGLVKALDLDAMQTEVLCIEYEDRRAELLAHLGVGWEVVWDNGVNVIVRRTK